MERATHIDEEGHKEQSFGSADQHPLLPEAELMGSLPAPALWPWQARSGVEEKSEENSQ